MVRPRRGEAALEEELDNVALAMELCGPPAPPQAAEGCGCEAPRVNPADLKDAAAALPGRDPLPLFHDIRGSFDREPGTFDLVELFEDQALPGHHGAGHRRLRQNAGAGGAFRP